MSSGGSGLLERAKYGAIGLAAGLFIGIILGWMFHGFVGALVRMVLIIIILLPFVFAIIFWVRTTNKGRVQESGIQEAEWRDRSGPR